MVITSVLLCQDNLWGLIVKMRAEKAGGITMSRIKEAFMGQGQHLSPGAHVLGGVPLLASYFGISLGGIYAPSLVLFFSNL